MKKTWLFIIMLAVAVMAAGCGQASGNDRNVQQDEVVTQAGNDTTADVENEAVTGSVAEDDNGAGSPDAETETTQETSATELVVRFGDSGSPFTLYLYDNDTAAAIARHVGTADWRLPIYHYDDYDGWEYMQYYDIPSRYEIPSDPEEITTVAAGEVYYSEPNRIVLFYQDAEISAEYTRVGYFDATDEFVEAVEDNPVLEGWGNKIVNISDGN